MKNALSKSLLWLLLVIPFTSFTLTDNLPDKWFKVGKNTELYEVGIAKGEGMNGTNCGIIKSVNPKVSGFADLTQMIATSGYAGEKIKVTVYMKAVGLTAKKWVGFWLLVDKQVFSVSISRDTKEENGTWKSDWKKYELVADIPLQSKYPYFSIAGRLFGGGQLWFDNVAIEVINSNQVAEAVRNSAFYGGPDNLDFEK